MIATRRPIISPTSPPTDNPQQRLVSLEAVGLYISVVIELQVFWVLGAVQPAVPHLALAGRKN